MTMLFIDSADCKEIATVSELGLACGATTNPKLMRAVTDDPLKQLEELLELGLVEIYYQPTGAYGVDLESEAKRAFALAPDRVIIKAMATPSGVAIASLLINDEVPVFLTGVQSEHAMIIAMELGCRGIIPYYDRGLKDPAVANNLVTQLAEVRKGRFNPKILAASVKSREQVMEAFHQGADAVSTSANVIRELISHPSSLTAEQDFLAQYSI